MLNQTEYIFEKDFWGNWKLVPRRNNSGFWLIILVIFVIIALLGILTSPFWIALLGFKMVKNKRHYSGIGVIFASIYFLMDITNKWISGFMIYGYTNSEGKFNDGLLGEKSSIYFYLINGIGLIIGLFFLYNSYQIKKNKI